MGTGSAVCRKHRIRRGRARRTEYRGEGDVVLEGVIASIAARAEASVTREVVG